jgi:hypothetical protein
VNLTNFDISSGILAGTTPRMAGKTRRVKGNKKATKKKAVGMTDSRNAKIKWLNR